MDLRKSDNLCLKRIQFVTPVFSNVDEYLSTPRQVPLPDLNVKLDGKEIKEFYEELVQRDSETPSAQPGCKTSSKALQDMVKGHKAVPSSLSSDKSCTDNLSDMELTKLNRDLLFSSQNGDLKTVTKLLKRGADLNATDMFSWTSLMCACHSGSFSVTEYLLSLGARTDIKNSQGRTALDLAKIAHRSDILNLFNGKACQAGKSGKNRVEKTVERFFCDNCGRDFSDTTKKAHESSTIHLFNLRKPSRPTGYLIPESNPGYQIMVKGGWDTEKGLGPTGQGRKFPVKTTLKMDRAGIGIETDAKPRVTHPAPQISGEGAKTSRHPRDGSNSRRAIKRKEQIKDKKWERKLRMALTLD
ncbi:G patch domain and ankyrin repeat-containing protein 1-like [Lineus longissimus]|uniref:G patch domain and ankyrin repeat-containing protein 1-like n=1 Tax=Lineus longissimus TaxID=88925 RepID=UPI00315D6568